MCGIAGIVGPARQASESTSQLLDAMSEALSRRGPDDRGSWSDGYAGLCHTRLSIIDLSDAGHQPMVSRCNRYVLVFNGEIYNYRELRKRLQGSGHRFRSDCDSETIVHLYEDLGTKCFEHLNGMFSIAIWDRPKRKLILARDRLGKKPLYYSCQQQQIVFGSELKALAEVPGFDRSISAGAIDQFLTYQYIPHPNTIYQNAKKVPPGHFVEVTKSRGDGVDYRVKRYWNVDLSHEEDIPQNEACEQLTNLLGDSIRLRLRSDVPLGAFLSGGIDSSLIVALASEQLDTPLNTFSIGFRENDFDETPFAAMVANWVKSEHREHRVEPDAVDVLDRLMWHYDEPFGDSSAIPTWYLCEQTRKYVTVALSGDGGDELFAGYDRYRALWMSQWSNRLLPVAPILGSKLVQGLPASNKQRSFIRRLQRFGGALNQPLSRRYMNWLQIFSEKLRAELYRDDFVEQLPDEDPFEFFESSWKQVGDRDLVSKASLADLVTYLPCDLMNKVDIASMAHSLECRQPFLDYRLVEFAVRLGSSHKFGLSGGKLILRRTYNKKLPRQIWTRKKMGFGVPLGSWFQNELRQLTEDRLLSTDSRCHAYFKVENLRQLVSQHMTGQINHCYRLWNLLVLETWLRRWSV